MQIHRFFEPLVGPGRVSCGGAEPSRARSMRSSRFARGGGRLERRQAVLLCFVFLGLALSACGSDEEPIPAAIPTPTPTVVPFPTPIVSEEPLAFEYYLIARKEGLYCLGHKTGDEPEEVYPEARLWIPWPLETKQTFESFLPRELNPRAAPVSLEVYSTNATLETSAGTFDNVVDIDGEDQPGSGYLRSGYSFRPQLGILDEGFGAGRGNLYVNLTALSVHGGGDRYELRFALAEGNRWDFDLGGQDSLGALYSGHVTRTITGRKLVQRENAFVLQVSGTLVITYYR
jgi:hypothetical protein